MSILSPVSQIGDTLEPGDDQFWLLAGATFIPGDTVLCPVNSDGTYTTCTTPTAASTGVVASAIASDGVFGVVRKGATSGNYARVQIRGEVDANMLSTAAASITVGGTFIPNTSKQLEFDQGNGVTNAKWVALFVGAGSTVSSSTSTPAIRKVWFNGIEGFGRHGGSTS